VLVDGCVPKPAAVTHVIGYSRIGASAQESVVNPTGLRGTAHTVKLLSLKVWLLLRSRLMRA
jgi:hypothetical protein